MVRARVRWPHDASVQHSVEAQVVDEDEAAGGLAGDVDARHRSTDDAVVADRLLHDAAVEAELDATAVEQRAVGDAAAVARMHDAVADGQRVAVRAQRRGRAIDETGAGLRRRDPQRRRVDLDRRARDGGALIGRHRGVAHHHRDPRRRHVEFLGDDLRQRRAEAGAEVDVSVQRDDRAVVPDRQQHLVAFGRIGRDGGRLPRDRRGGRPGSRGHVAQHQQHAARRAEVLARAQARRTAHRDASRSIATSTAATISTWVPQRHRLCDSAAAISAASGLGVSPSNAVVAMIIPFRQ